MFMAVMLMRFDMELVEGEGLVEEARFPRMDDTPPSGGIQGPLCGEDLIVRVRPCKAM